ncbi:mevalonate kinase [Archaeoglobus sulfaticallidus PM70-1]|uniref:Mevalonate kinase n=1 Tax=Archaeoglobus sulfaticallidus PM70-1 TaxID=387631 RepID=N0BC50_9EURY|nr:mevalonate kinase [Archaeoglobus sulfaticallidus]AGK60558.1 mevalonate kinase [Archaeoglobus sulfaticallidus PM70-1]
MIASAPGKLFLFGEHAVVYKKKAIVTAINLRCFAKVSKRDEFRISSPLGVTGLDFNIHPYISHAILRFREVRDIRGADIEIKSQIPPASGLGSSSAVTVAVLKALDAEFEAALTNEEIYEMARMVELDVQGIGSGTDPFLSTYGGSWIIPDRSPLNLGKIHFLIIDSGIKSYTKEMVNGVASLRERYPEVIDAVMDAIGKVSESAIPALENRDYDKIFDLFRINQCLLKAIGVSRREIDEMIAKLEELGISAKITGAGGGGCIIGLGEKDALTKATEIFGNAFFVKPEKEGVRIEG